MENYVKGDFGFVNITPLSHIISEEGYGYLNELKAQLQDFSEKKIKTIFFIQLTDVEDDLVEWEKVIRNDILLHDLYKKILFFRSILYQLRKEKQQFIYIGGGNCLGAFWELALCCDKRMWFAADGLVGFPEIDLGYFPIGGSLDFLAEVSSRTKDQWLEQATLTLTSAKEKGFIDFLGGSTFHPEYAIKWVEANTEGALGKKALPEQNFEPLGWHQINDLEKQWLEIKRITSLLKSWDYAWSLNKSKRWFKSSQEYENLISFILARFMLAPSLRRLASQDGMKSLESEHLDQRVVYIDSELWAPPLEIFSNLLLNKYRIVFYGRNPKVLASLLERMFLKIDRLHDKQHLKKLWSKYVSWFHGHRIGPSSIAIRWNIGDTIEIFHNNKGFRFLNLESNLFDAKKGYLERITESSEQNEGQIQEKTVVNLLSQISYGVIKEKIIGKDTPISSWVRLMILQEIIKLANNFEGDIDKFLTNLNQKGWRFAGSEERWGHFLQTRRGSVYPEEGICFPDRDVWNLGRWKQVYTLLKPAQKPSRNWNPAEMEVHLSLYLFALSEYLCKANFFNDEVQSLLLLSEAIGFPRDLGNPKDYMMRWGSRRYRLYKKRFWGFLER
ncbi:MAG: hypothetical protein HRU09_05245 [Oligoflexales bacterium]|nr:hypothetical protein [Oligoflexales bacterium]